MYKGSTVIIVVQFINLKSDLSIYFNYIMMVKLHILKCPFMSLLLMQVGVEGTSTVDFIVPAAGIIIKKGGKGEE